MKAGQRTKQAPSKQHAKPDNTHHLLVPAVISVRRERTNSARPTAQKHRQK